MMSDMLIDKTRRSVLAAVGGIGLLGCAEASVSVAPVSPNGSSSQQSYVSVKDFGATGDGRTDDTVAIQACLAFCTKNNRIAFFPATTGSYKISGPLVYTGPGINMEAVGYGNGVDGSLQVTGSGYTALTVTGIATQIVNVAMFGSGNAANGLQLGKATDPVKVQGGKIRVNRLAGHGVLIDTMWDSFIETISVEQCGTESLYAFQVTSSGDTSNETHFGRLQVEQSRQLAIHIATETLNCQFDVIHSERAVVVDASPDKPTWHFGGTRSQYNTVRLHSVSPLAYATINGALNQFNVFATEASVTLQMNNFGSIDFNVGKIDGVLTFIGGSDKFSFSGCVIANLKHTVRNFTNFKHCSIKNASFGFCNNNAAASVFEDCFINNMSSTDNTAAATFVRCNIAGGTHLGGYTILHESTINLGAACVIGFAKLEAYNSKLICHALTVNSAYLGLYGTSTVNGNLTMVGNLQSVAGADAYVAGTVTGWGAPAFTDLLPTYPGMRSKNLAPALGAPKAWVCTTGMKWVSEGNL